MTNELLNDYPLRNRAYYRQDGYAAKLDRIRAVADRLQDQRNEALRRTAELEAENCKLKAQLEAARAKSRKVSSLARQVTKTLKLQPQS